MHSRQVPQPKGGCASYLPTCEGAGAAVAVDSPGDTLESHPAHFGRSPCGGRNLGCRPFSTIGYERRFNLAFQLPTPDAFAWLVLSTLRPQSDDFRRIERESLGWSRAGGGLPAGPLAGRRGRSRERRLCVTEQEIRQALGKQVKLELAPQAAGGPSRTGRIVGTLDAADGMVVTFAPDDAPGSRVTYHAHYIRAIHPV